MSNKISLYYANWCGHCVKFKPEWNKLKSQCPKGYVCEAFEDQENEQEVRNAGIQGFPTIRITKNGQTRDYQGPRNADAIIKSLSVQTGGSRKFTEKDYERMYYEYKRKYLELKRELGL